MARVAITVLGFKCDRCGHEWVARDSAKEPWVCPKCKSPYWNIPRKRNATTYEEFRGKIENALQATGRPMTWTEIRTATRLPQLFPNNRWVKRLESEINLVRQRNAQGIIYWRLGQEE